MDEKAIIQIPTERVMQGMVALQNREVRDHLQRLRQNQLQFLKIRAMTSTDAMAMHLLGNFRQEGDDRPCICSQKKPGWRDMREQTLLAWKKDETFKFVYDMLLTEPVMFASATMQTLATKAVMAYDDLLEADQKPEVRRAAARDVLEAVDLKATPGVQGSGKAMYDPAFRMALERHNRGLELSDGQKQLLLEGGVVIEGEFRDVTDTERDLNGNDVPRRGGDNSEYLPD